MLIGLLISVSERTIYLEANEKRLSLSIDRWYELSKEDVYLPMRIMVYGTSMSPLIRIKRDFVTIVPLKREPIVGDIVLFRDYRGDRYVLHRVWKVEGDTVLTFGDHCICPDAPMTRDCVWGLAVKIERGKRVIPTDSDKARKWGLKWAKAEHKLFPLYQRTRSFAARIYHKIIGRK